MTILHVQRADQESNLQAWGGTGFSRQAALVAKSVLIIYEEILVPEVIRADPDRTLLPGLAVSAICKVPWGAHPVLVQRATTAWTAPDSWSMSQPPRPPRATSLGWLNGYMA
ncbi:hypothetical protein DFAR_2460012 [Desulfarculales bacterium]